MKNKTKTYVLLVAVLGVWGLIGYKIISTINPETPMPQSQNMVANFIPLAATESDTFSIQKVVRDPFLGTLTQHATNATNNRPPATPPLLWPQIIYGGMVKKQNSATQIFVLTINEKQHLLKKGHTVDEVTVVTGNSKEIVVRYRNHNKTIIRQQ